LSSSRPPWGGITIQQVADWLEKLGLSEYTARFAENGIDISVLRYLTDQDLKDIGVLLGHRRKMLAAISKCVAQMTSRLDYQKMETMAESARRVGSLSPSLT
jgi:SAM domain (Sterile alpha motif)